MLVSLDARSLGASTVVTIKADGAVGNYNAFELDDPSRIVVDVWGVRSTMADSHVNVGDDNLKAVRIGNHLDKARLVFDSEGSAPPTHSIVKSGDSIVVTIGETPEESISTAGELAYAEPLETAPVGAQDEAMEDEVSGAQTLAMKSAEVDTETLALWDTPPALSATEALPAETAIVATEAAPETIAVVEPPAEAAPEMVAVVEPTAPLAPDTFVDEGALDAAVSSEPVIEEPTPEAVMAAPTPPVEPYAPVLSIRTIDFRKLPERAVLTVEASGQTDFNVTESKDGSTIAIDVRNSVIPDDLKRTLDATKLETAVLSISSYQEAIAPEKVVRILVKLKGDAVYEVSEAGGALIIDFPDEVAVMAAKAEEPEVEEIPASVMSVTGKEYTGKRIDLDMTDASIHDILRLMAEVSDLNIIAADNVQGTVSLRLKDVPWDQAFDIILKSHGLDTIEEGNVIRVAPVDVIRQERESKVASAMAEEKLEETKLEFLPVNYGEAASLVPHVTNVLTDRGSVTSEERTNTLIIKDIQKGIDAARDLVSRLDTSIPQVLIEARIVEATSSFARDLGIQWGLDYQTGGNVSTDTFGATTTSGQTPPSETTNAPLYTTRHGAGNYAVNLPATGSAGTLGALGFIFGKVGANPLLLDLRLTAGEQQGRLKTISRPRVTTLDNKEAKIEQGESIPFSTTSAAGTATTFIDANLSLTVTPHITPDGSVLMQIKASRNSIGTFRSASGEPSINRKEASTEVLVKDGETTVIGGIVVSDSSHTDRGIPLLKNIPVFGWLFKSKSISDTQTELLIFITPTIMKDQVIG
jgi:type IV pilus assembly protein PilQ